MSVKYESQPAPGERIAGPVPTPDVNVANNALAGIATGRIDYSYGEAARAVGCSARTIWSEVAKGDLRAARVGRRRLIGVDELRRWLDAKSGIATAVAIGDGR